MNFIYRVINISKLERFFFYKVFRKIVGYILVVLYFIIYSPFLSFRKLKDNEVKDIIVSLTSFGERVKNVAYTIETILGQSTKPNKIILYLSKDEFGSIKQLPKALQKQTRRGLEIVFVEDLKPHKKYYFSFKKYNDSIIITFDDDVFYPKKSIKYLMDEYYINRNLVIANRCRKIVVENNNFTEYSKWPNITNKTSPSHLNLAIGIAGILYSPRLFNDNIYNKELIYNRALKADDLWLKINEVISDIPVLKTSSPYYNLLSIPGSQRKSLTQENVNNKNNDVVFKSLVDEFRLTPDNFNK